MEALMLRGLAGLLLVVLCTSAGAQTPEKKPTLILELKTGETVMLQDATKVGDNQLCGLVRYTNKPPGPNCLFLNEISGAQFGDPKSLILSSTFGAVCAAAAPVCFGAVTSRAEQGVKAAVAAKAKP